MQVADALFGHRRAALGLRQDKCALQYDLCVQRKAFGCPRSTDAIPLHRIGNVGLQAGGLTADACIACVANVGVRRIYLLNHRAGETGKLCNFTAQHCLAEIKITEDAIKRIVESMVGGGGEKRAA